jgi:hypothetical protein
MQSLPFFLLATTVWLSKFRLSSPKIAYQRAEIVYLNDQLRRDQPFRFTDPWRKRLARTSSQVG